MWKANRAAKLKRCPFLSARLRRSTAFAAGQDLAGDPPPCRTPHRPRRPLRRHTGSAACLYSQVRCGRRVQRRLETKKRQPRATVARHGVHAPRLRDDSPRGSGVGSRAKAKVKVGFGLGSSRRSRAQFCFSSHPADTHTARTGDVSFHSRFRRFKVALRSIGPREAGGLRLRGE